MKPRAVIFDVYETLLEVGPPPVDVETRWASLWEKYFHQSPPLSLAEFGLTCERWIREDHAQAHVRGISFPEVHWPRIACLAAPDLASLDSVTLDAFLFEQAQIWHQVRLANGTAQLLQWLHQNGVAMGIASNAQAYTVAELDREISAAGLDIAWFHPKLRFWSFEHGFSKPDPHVFRILQARLWAMDIPPEAVLMVGDRVDNDIQPAQAAGWQAWQIGVREEGAQGNMEELLRALQAS